MKIKIDGLNISYNIYGDAKDTIVFLQGWGTSYRIYEPIANFLSTNYKVVLFDFPGFGESTEPPEPWAVSDYASFFTKLMSELNIESATLMGHSYGGRVIIKALTVDNTPLKVDRVVLIDAAGVVPERSPKQQAKVRRYKILKKLLDNDIMHYLFPDIIDHWKSKQGSADYRAASDMMKKCLVLAVNEDLKHLMPDLKQEVLLIWGENDTATPIGDAKIMESLMPDASLVAIPGAGHFSFVDRPDIFYGVLGSYLIGES